MQADLRVFGRCIEGASYVPATRLRDAISLTGETYVHISVATSGKQPEVFTQREADPNI